MSSNRSIVERSVDLLKPSGERVSFRVEFGPIRSVGQDSRCRVRFTVGGIRRPTFGATIRFRRSCWQWISFTPFSLISSDTAAGFSGLARQTATI